MSGTSLDGIDVALLVTDGEDVVERGPSATYPYRPDQQALLQDAITAARTLERRDGRPGILGNAERALTDWHAEAVERFAAANGLGLPEIDLIGFHGQTVIHRPEPLPHRDIVARGEGVAPEAGGLNLGDQPGWALKI
jgi:anhydro-N-acetylmuramic acid kinase